MFYIQSVFACLITIAYISKHYSHGFDSFLFLNANFFQFATVLITTNKDAVVEFVLSLQRCFSVFSSYLFVRLLVTLRQIVVKKKSSPPAPPPHPSSSFGHFFQALELDIFVCLLFNFPTTLSNSTLSVFSGLFFFHPKSSSIAS